MKKFLWILSGIMLGMMVASATAQKLSEKDVMPQIKTNGLDIIKPTVATPTVYEKSRDAIYFEDFESVPTTMLPTGWTTVANPADDIWLAGSVMSNSTPLSGHSGSKYASLLYNGLAAHDSWAFSPALELTAGVSYNISFWVQLRAYQNIFEALEVKIGTEATAAGMTTLLYDENEANITAWHEVFYRFTPVATGTYYIGFHSYSPANSNATMIDDIKVEATPTGA
ncbi:MAG: choice-of-anchor J domain-containing protein, partial [Cytophagaceae bacterium]|nr:choice-of-anchor J domain-containing protein [Cytophagaceae bacterium]